MVIVLWYIIFQEDQKPALRSNAVPRILTGPGVPAYISKPTSESRDNHSKRRKVVQPSNEAKQEQWLDADRIPSYATNIRTAEFMDIVIKFWTIVNHKCKEYYKGSPQKTRWCWSTTWYRWQRTAMVTKHGILVKISPKVLLKFWIFWES